MKSLFMQMFCLHDWIKADSFENPYPKIRYAVGSHYMWICKKCGKTTLFPKDT